MATTPTTMLARARPRRGTPAETRARLVAAAARVFDRDGFHGTDSNRLARAAGYAPGTFYKHFADKREVFVAAYAQWVTAEWDAISREIAAGGPDVAGRVVARVLEFHRRWRGFRASLQVLVRTDPAVRRAYRRQRRRQLTSLRALRRTRGLPPRSAEDDALLLYTLERACDAVADGEPAALGLDPARLVAGLCALVAVHMA